MKAPPSWPNHLPTAPTPDTSILGFKISTEELGKHTNIQSIPVPLIIVII